MPPKGTTNNHTGRHGYSEEIASLRDAARCWTHKALERVVHMIDNGSSDEIQLKACEMLLDRAWGKPSQQIDLIRHDMQVISSLSREDLLELAPAAMALLSGAKDVT